MAGAIVAKEKRRMKMSKLTLSIVAIVGMLMIGSTAYGDHFLPNGDFEDGSPIPTGWSGGVASNWEPEGTHGFTGHGIVLTSGSDFNLTTDFTLDAGTYQWSIWGAAWDVPSTAPWLNIYLGTTGINTTDLLSLSYGGTAVWPLTGATLVLPDFTIASGGTTVYLTLKPKGNGGVGGIYVDDIVITPEPATMAFLGLGTLGTMLLRRRKSRK